MVIKRVGPLSAAKVAGTLYAALGIVVGGLFSMIAVAGGFASDESGAAGVGALIGAGAIFVFPILYGCAGFLAALIGAWLYNLFAGLVGGVELEVQ